MIVSDVSKQELEIMGALRRLLKSRFLLRSNNEKWFQTILDQRAALQRHFDALGVHLDINESLGVIHVRSHSEELEELIGFQLGKKMQLGPIASLMMIQVRMARHQFFLNPTSSLVPLITAEQLRDFIAQFSAYKIDSQFERAYRKALDELIDLQVLRETQGNENLFEITPVCELLLPADRIQELQGRAKEYFGPSRPLMDDDAIAKTGNSTISANDSLRVSAGRQESDEGLHDA